MAFYEQKVGLSLEFQMTTFLSRVAALGSDGVGLHETEPLDCSFTREGVIQRLSHTYRSSFVCVCLCVCHPL